MDGTNMPQSTASFTQTEAQSYTSDIEALLATVHAKLDLVKANPTQARIAALEHAIGALHNALRDLSDEAVSRLSPAINGPLYSGGTDKPRQAEA